MNILMYVSHIAISGYGTDESFCILNKQLYGHMRDLEKGNKNNNLVKHSLETNHNFNFKDFKMLVYIHNLKNTGKLLNLVSFQTTILLETWILQFVSSYRQIGAESLFRNNLVSSSTYT